MGNEKLISEKTTVVVTSISEPNAILASLAKGCHLHNCDFIVVGDSGSPPEFNLDYCDYYGVDRQLETGFVTAAKSPLRHYARKNIGYLLAMRNKSEIIVETDDDNFPLDGFWQERNVNQRVRALEDEGWINVYGYFTQNNENVWPRGLPLDCIHLKQKDFDLIPEQDAECPIQQGLADNNPDVDAIFRLVHDQKICFRNDRRLVLKNGTWSPFNSQNTTWWRKAFPLLYLPAFCSFRMTDIWRSFVAMRICWENNWGVLFHEPTVSQERNEHDLMKDFSDEIPGYLKNKLICNELGKLSLKSGTVNINENLLICYEKLVQLEVVEDKELSLVQAWVDDIESIERNI